MKLKISFSKKSIVIFTTIVLIVTISFTVQPKDNPNIFERAISTIFYPVQVAVRWPINKVKSSLDFFSGMRYFEEENKKLKSENTLLKEQLRGLESAGNENEELRNLLNLKDKYDTSNSIVAEVISFDSTSWFDVITINKGSNDGVKKDMVILTPSGLVGKVTQVFEHTSQVTSILDVTNVVSARLTKTGDLVTTKGDMELAVKGLLRLNYVTSDILLSEDDVIETSGMGGIYPKGIFIGTISKVEQDSNSLRTYAIIRPGVNFNKLSDVLVISNPEGE